MGGGGLVTELYLTFVTPWTVAHQAPLSMGFSRQECWSGLPFPSPGDLLDPRIQPTSPALQVYSLPLSHQESPWKIIRTQLIDTAFNPALGTGKSSGV